MTLKKFANRGEIKVSHLVIKPLGDPKYEEKFAKTILVTNKVRYASSYFCKDYPNYGKEYNNP